MHLLISDFSSLIRGERHNSLKSFVSYYANITPNIRHISGCFRSQFIFAGRDPKNLTDAATVENSILYAPMADSFICLHGPISNLPLHGKTPTSQHHSRTSSGSFSKFSNSQPISSGYDIIHTPASFPVWDLLWQWWLSYPLRMSVNCTNWLHTWTLNLKPNQTEW